jgi:hypothetical protein
MLAFEILRLLDGLKLELEFQYFEIPLQNSGLKKNVIKLVGSNVKKKGSLN